MDVPIEMPCGKVTWVSQDDWPRVSKLAWSSQGSHVRARYKRSVGGDGHSYVYLHRYILAAPKGYVVDHIDGNPLNNRRENLQIATYSRNIMRAYAGGTVGMAGNRWRARMRVDGRPVSLGCYATREEAQAALVEARKMVWSDPAINELGIVG